ncbi:MAG: cytochrome C [Rubrivivax sp.]|nr:cytochrome C [Rubrivivax sp.]
MTFTTALSPARRLRLRLPLLAVCCSVGLSAAWAQSRGELLYGTHCLACHNTEMHWRDKKQVTDWPSLRAQVRRWQAADQLAWSDDDIEQVARHLNELFYRLPLPAGARPMAMSAPARPR